VTFAAAYWTLPLAFSALQEAWHKIPISAHSLRNGATLTIDGVGRWYVASDKRDDIELLDIRVVNPNFIGVVTSVAAKKGDTLIARNVGKVEVGQQDPLGLEGTFDGARWTFPLGEWKAANVNPSLVIAEGGKPPTGYWVSPSNTDRKITQERDQTSDFTRILSTKENSYLVLNGQDPMRQALGQPISLKIDIRVPHSREVVATIHDVLGSDGRAKSSRFAFNAPAGEWVTIVLRAPVIAFSSPSDNYSIGLTSVKAGDYFDLREISVFEGILP
jgi:hypothetical protein